MPRDRADEDEHADEPGRAAGAQRRVALVEGGAQKPSPTSAPAAMAEPTISERRVGTRTRHPHVAQQGADAGVALRWHRRLHRQ